MSQRSTPKPPKILFYSFPLFFQLFKICAEHEEWNERVKRYRVTMAEACLSHFGINPLWLTSTVEIKAVICLKRLNNVKHSVKHTPAALYIMNQRPAEGKDNMTYPQERREEREGKKEVMNRQVLREKQRLDGDRGGNERVSNEDLTRVYHPQYAVDWEGMAEEDEEEATPKGPQGCSHNSH